MRNASPFESPRSGGPKPVTVETAILTLSVSSLLPIAYPTSFEVKCASFAMAIIGLSYTYLIKDTEFGQTLVSDYFFGNQHSEELASNEILNDGYVH